MKLKNFLKKAFDQNQLQEQIADPYKTTLRDFTILERENIEFVKPYTMTSDERLVSLSRCIDYIHDNNIQGDIVECGVWRGGSMMLVARKLLQLKSSYRKLFLFDTFEGMTEPGKDDIAWDNITAVQKLNASNKFEGRNVWCYSTLDEVKSNLLKTQYPGENVIYVKGKVEKTLPFSAIEKISLLRLDTDWYESTKHELEHLYDKLVYGGVLIIDDYGHWEGAKKAVDEFIQKNGLKLYLNRIDYTGRLAIKNS